MTITVHGQHDGKGIEPTEFRFAMAEFATGVTVVTAHDSGGPVGFVCQSFASVSLDPPMVLFCVDHRSRSWPRIREAGRFCVNVLADHQREVCQSFGSSQGKKFDGAQWELSGWGVPVLSDVLMRVHADIDSVTTAGDHDVVIGRVIDVERVDGGHRPMVFFRGAFGS
ncbi:flavin reductase family protein [Gordonia sp. NPDC127522]|uniref:flavin reductase family protein n=1 Tax=Gordonia sp. NPDC127522 TaxID=3345390 RepID=UPI00363D1FBF